MLVQVPTYAYKSSCGASDGKDEKHLQAARDLAQVFHKHNVHLIYGGGTVGIMGELAKTLVSLSGPEAVHGIIPQPLLAIEREKNGEIDKKVFGRTTIVKGMHDRKKLMKDEVVSGGPGSGFVAMSGGYGTFEELLEMTTWSQLNIQQKPIVVLNIDGLFDGLYQWINSAVDLGFIKPENQRIIANAKSAEEVYENLINYNDHGQVRMPLEWSDGLE